MEKLPRGFISRLVELYNNYYQATYWNRRSSFIRNQVRLVKVGYRGVELHDITYIVMSEYDLI
jgi:hypothetical protein